MLATVASLTSAGRIKKCAAANQIKAAVIQTPHALTHEGCGYSVRFDDSAEYIVKKCADELHIKIRSVFIEEKTDNNTIYRKK